MAALFMVPPWNSPFFSSRWVLPLLELIPVGLFSTLHLWTNSLAMQGRHVFETTVVPLISSAGFTALELSIVYVPLLWQIGRDARQRPGEAAKKEEAPTKRRVRRMAAAATFFCVSYVLYSSRVRVWLGRIDAYDLHPTLCAELSATTSQGIPAIAALYLACYALVAVRLARAVESASSLYGASDRPSASPIAVALSTGIGVLTFCAWANAVLYFVTGAGLV